MKRGRVVIGPASTLVCTTRHRSAIESGARSVGGHATTPTGRTGPRSSGHMLVDTRNYRVRQLTEWTNHTKDELS
jgi:hypothetical protein